MKIQSITSPNTKGQIVIPKKMRDALKIDENVRLKIVMSGKGIFISPISNVITEAETENSYLKILKKTQGGWKDEDWDELDKIAKKRSEVELAAAKKLKKESW